MRISRLLNLRTWLVGQFLCLPTAYAQTVEASKTETIASLLTPAISASYVRSAADQDSAYYKSVAAMEFSLAYTFLDSSSLELKSGVSRDLDALEERNVWSSTSLAFASRDFELTNALDISNALTFAYKFNAVAPTNADMRNFLSYRGSLEAGAGLSQAWSNFPIGNTVKVGMSGSVTRNFFEYDASEAGVPNTMLTLGSGVNGQLSVNKMLGLAANYGLQKVRKTNGTWGDLRYVQTISAQLKPTENLALTVSQSTGNRTYTYDAQTLQFALYDYQTTYYELAATYTF